MKVKFNKIFGERSEYQGRILTLVGIYGGSAICKDDEGNRLWFPDVEHFETYYEKVNELNKLAEIIYGKFLIKDSIPAGTVDKTMCSGKTTAEALRVITEAMKSPGVAVEIVDNTQQHVHRAEFRDEVKKMIDKLDFEFFIINPHKNTITFDI